MKIDLNDIIAMIGLSCLSGGITVRYGWDMALIVVGALLFVLSVWRAR